MKIVFKFNSMFNGHAFMDFVSTVSKYDWNTKLKKKLLMPKLYNLSPKKVYEILSVSMSIKWNVFGGEGKT